ncbi:MAG: ATP-dependent sacrificial sulfur transferase LarE [Acidobacteria bacterium]|nr:ATP-dependent sacrificial sulfur transferase LarE [Acidobacteriota bacterium]
MSTEEQKVKYQKLLSLLKEMGSVVVAYSGGVDSAFLAKAANEALGPDFLAVTGISETYTEDDLKEAREFAKAQGFRHQEINTKELANREFAKNPENRCYYCKSELFLKLRKIAASEGIKYLADGTNTDDIAYDIRPGLQAASECGVRHPIAEAGLCKQDLRDLAHEMALPFWNKPAAACLSSRIPYGQDITTDKLEKVARAESFLRSLGFSQVRVRHHDTIARIELVPEELSKAIEEEVREKIFSEFKDIGYTYVTLDLKGYRMGSMNEANRENGQEEGFKPAGRDPGFEHSGKAPGWFFYTPDKAG